MAREDGRRATPRCGAGKVLWAAVLDAFEIRLRAERRIGEMLEAGKEEARQSDDRK